MTLFAVISLLIVEYGSISELMSLGNTLAFKFGTAIEMTAFEPSVDALLV